MTKNLHSLKLECNSPLSHLVHGSMNMQISPAFTHSHQRSTHWQWHVDVIGYKVVWKHRWFQTMLLKLTAVLKRKHSALVLTY